MAYPIQGLLKYHGLSDPLQRIAYFPSISLCNDAIMTITYCKFSPNEIMIHSLSMENLAKEKKPRDYKSLWIYFASSILFLPNC